MKISIKLSSLVVSEICLLSSPFLFLGRQDSISLYCSGISLLLHYFSKTFNIDFEITFASAFSIQGYNLFGPGDLNTVNMASWNHCSKLVFPSLLVISTL